MEISQQTIPHKFRNKYLRSGAVSMNGAGSTTYSSVSDGSGTGSGNANHAEHATKADLAEAANHLAEVLNIYGNPWSGTTDLEAISATTIDADSIVTDELTAITGNINALTATTINSTNINNSDTIKTKNLDVTGSAHFFQLIIDKIKAAGGAIMLTPADGFKVDKVTEIEGGYRLYFRSTDENGKGITNMWKVNDQALCKSFNEASVGTSYNVSNKYYWSLVTAIDEAPVKVSIDSVEHDCHYIDISTTTKDGTVDPEVDDEIVMCGYRGEDDETRQSAIYISAYASMDKGLTAPLFATYRGINDFDLESHRKTFIDASGAEFIGSLKVSDGTSVEDYITSATTEIYNEFVVNAEGLVSKVTKKYNPNILASNGWKDQDENAIYQENDEDYTLSASTPSEEEVVVLSDDELIAYPPVMYLNTGRYTMSVYNRAKYTSVKYGFDKDNLEYNLNVHTMINTGDTWHNQVRAVTVFEAPINGYYQFGMQPMDENYSGDTEYKEYEESGDGSISGGIETKITYELTDEPQIVGTTVSGITKTHPELYGGSVTYESSDNSVAVVNSLGNVTLMSVGEATITAWAHSWFGEDGLYNDSKATATIKANNVFDTSIKLTLSNSYVDINDTIKATATVIPKHYPYKVQFSSSDTSVLTVDADGTVHGVGRGGAYVIATAAYIEKNGLIYNSSTAMKAVNVATAGLTPESNQVIYIPNQFNDTAINTDAFNASFVSSEWTTSGLVMTFDSDITSVSGNVSNGKVEYLNLPPTISGLSDNFEACEYNTRDNCTKYLELHNGTNSIGNFAFKQGNLNGIIMPNSMTSIGDGFLAGGNAGFEEFVYPNNVESTLGNDFNGCSGIKYVNTNNVKKIDGYFLANCKTIDTVVLGENTQFVDYRAFFYTNQQSIYTSSGFEYEQLPFNIVCKAVTPPFTYYYTPNWGRHAFSSLYDPSLIKLYVPDESINNYRDDIAWGVFDIHPMSEYIPYVTNNEYKEIYYPAKSDDIVVSGYNSVQSGNTYNCNITTFPHGMVKFKSLTPDILSFDGDNDKTGIAKVHKIGDAVVEVESYDFAFGNKVYKGGITRCTKSFKNGDRYYYFQDNHYDYSNFAMLELYLDAGEYEIWGVADRGCIFEVYDNENWEIIYTDTVVYDEEPSGLVQYWGGKYPVPASFNVYRNTAGSYTETYKRTVYKTTLVISKDGFYRVKCSGVPYQYKTGKNKYETRYDYFYGVFVSDNKTTHILPTISLQTEDCYKANKIYTLSATTNPTNCINKMTHVIGDDNVLDVIALNLRTKKNGLSHLTLKIPEYDEGAIHYYSATTETDILISDNVKAIYTSTDGNIIEPEGLDIVKNEYKGTYGEYTINLTSGITDSAWENSTTLKTIDLSETNVLNIGSDVFSGDTKLTDVKLPDTLFTISNGAFNGCTSLKNILIPSKVYDIGNYAFANCTSLVEFNFPDDEITVNNYVLSGCTSLSKIVLSNKVTSIGEKAFANCKTNLNVTCDTITPPKIASNAFENTTNPIIYVPTNALSAYTTANVWKDLDVRPLTEGNFIKVYYTSETGEREIPNRSAKEPLIPLANIYENGTGTYYFDTLDILPYQSFYYNKFTSIDFSDSQITTIGGKVFYNATHLTKVVLPNTITLLGNFIFDNSFQLHEITYMGTMEEWFNIEKYESLGTNYLTNSGINRIVCTDGVIGVKPNYWDESFNP